MTSSINKICVISQTDSNPLVLHESSLHPEKIMVCCGIWAGAVIAPYFFRDDQDGNCECGTVNENRYRSMITEYFWPQLDMNLEYMWLQQNGATSHTANVTINLLETKFGESVISRNRNVGSNVLLQESRILLISKTVFVVFKKSFCSAFIENPFINVYKY